jgi:serine/threonine protein kinase
MVSASGAVRVLDFGLAKLLEQEAAPANADKTTSLRTGTGELIGTLPYMSPEQLEGRPADARSDIFSLGAML